MRLTITIDLANAAFEDDPSELKEIFDAIYESVRTNVAGDGPLMDSDGNTVGAWRVS